MSFVISDEERDALRGLPHLAVVMYLTAIRPYMDYQTGVVGITRRISRRSLAECCYVEPVQGRHASKCGEPSVMAVRNTLDTLCGAGLLIPNPKLPMVFKLPHAFVRSFAQNMSNRGTADRSNRGAADENAGYTDVSDDQQPHEQPQKNAMNNLPPVSVNITTTTTSTELSTAEKSSAGGEVGRSVSLPDWVSDSQRQPLQQILSQSPDPEQVVSELSAYRAAEREIRSLPALARHLVKQQQAGTLIVGYTAPSDDAKGSEPTADPKAALKRQIRDLVSEQRAAESFASRFLSDGNADAAAAEQARADRLSAEVAALRDQLAA